MIETLKSMWLRLEVHWHAVAVSCVTVLPIVLDQLGDIDLRGILEGFMSQEHVTMVIALLPIIMVFMKPLLKVAEQADEDDTK